MNSNFEEIKKIHNFENGYKGANANDFKALSSAWRVGPTWIPVHSETEDSAIPNLICDMIHKVERDFYSKVDFELHNISEEVSRFVRNDKISLYSGRIPLTKSLDEMRMRVENPDKATIEHVFIEHEPSRLLLDQTGYIAEEHKMLVDHLRDSLKSTIKDCGFKITNDTSSSNDSNSLSNEVDELLPDFGKGFDDGAISTSSTIEATRRRQSIDSLTAMLDISYLNQVKEIAAINEEDISSDSARILGNNNTVVSDTVASSIKTTRRERSSSITNERARLLYLSEMKLDKHRNEMDFDNVIEAEPLELLHKIHSNGDNSEVIKKESNRWVTDENAILQEFWVKHGNTAKAIQHIVNAGPADISEIQKTAKEDFSEDPLSNLLSVKSISNTFGEESHDMADRVDKHSNGVTSDATNESEVEYQNPPFLVVRSEHSSLLDSILNDLSELGTAMHHVVSNKMNDYSTRGSSRSGSKNGSINDGLYARESEGDGVNVRWTSAYMTRFLAGEEDWWRDTPFRFPESNTSVNTPGPLRIISSTSDDHYDNYGGGSVKDDTLPQPRTDMKGAEEPVMVRPWSESIESIVDSVGSITNIESMDLAYDAAGIDHKLQQTVRRLEEEASRHDTLTNEGLGRIHSASTLEGGRVDNNNDDEEERFDGIGADNKSIKLSVDDAVIQLRLTEREHLTDEEGYLLVNDLREDPSVLSELLDIIDQLEQSRSLYIDSSRKYDMLQNHLPKSSSEDYLIDIQRRKNIESVKDLVSDSEAHYHLQQQLLLNIEKAFQRIYDFKAQPNFKPYLTKMVTLKQGCVVSNEHSIFRYNAQGTALILQRYQSVLPHWTDRDSSSLSSSSSEAHKDAMTVKESNAGNPMELPIDCGVEIGDVLVSVNTHSVAHLPKEEVFNKIDMAVSRDACVLTFETPWSFYRSMDAPGLGFRLQCPPHSKLLVISIVDIMKDCPMDTTVLFMFSPAQGRQRRRVLSPVRERVCSWNALNSVEFTTASSAPSFQKIGVNNDKSTDDNTNDVLGTLQIQLQQQQSVDSNDVNKSEKSESKSRYSDSMITVVIKRAMNIIEYIYLSEDSGDENSASGIFCKPDRRRLSQIQRAKAGLFPSLLQENVEELREVIETRSRITLTPSTFPLDDRSSELNALIVRSKKNAQVFVDDKIKLKQSMKRCYDEIRDLQSQCVALGVTRKVLEDVSTSKRLHEFNVDVDCETISTYDSDRIYNYNNDDNNDGNAHNGGSSVFSCMSNASKPTFVSLDYDDDDDDDYGIVSVSSASSSLNNELHEGDGGMWGMFTGRGTMRSLFSHGSQESSNDKPTLISEKNFKPNLSPEELAEKNRVQELQVLLRIKKNKLDRKKMKLLENEKQMLSHQDEIRGLETKLSDKKIKLHICEKNVEKISKVLKQVEAIVRSKQKSASIHLNVTDSKISDLVTRDQMRSSKEDGVSGEMSTIIGPNSVRHSTSTRRRSIKTGAGGSVVSTRTDKTGAGASVRTTRTERTTRTAMSRRSRTKKSVVSFNVEHTDEEDLQRSVDAYYLQLVSEKAKSKSKYIRCMEDVEMKGMLNVRKAQRKLEEAKNKEFEIRESYELTENYLIVMNSELEDLNRQNVKLTSKISHLQTDIKTLDEDIDPNKNKIMKWLGLWKKNNLDDMKKKSQSLLHTKAGHSSTKQAKVY